MTPERLLTHLSALPAEAPVIFESGAGPIGGGYHVTELKLALVTGIDCGARLAEWTEATLQLLDGPGEAPMTAGKLSAILAQSIGKVAGLGAAPLRVEFAHGNSGLRIWEIGTPEMAAGRVRIGLSEASAMCKPFEESAGALAGTGCCAPRPEKTACCG